MIQDFATSLEQAVASATLEKGSKEFPQNVADLSELSKRQITDPVGVFCNTTDCTGTCRSLDLFSEPVNTCLTPPSSDFFVSVFISNPSNVVLPFQLGFSNFLDCTSLILIPSSNVCFNIKPAFGEMIALITNTGT